MAKIKGPKKTNRYPDEFKIKAYSGSIGMAKIGRNSPCPCGSGKKYKRCWKGDGAK